MPFRFKQFTVEDSRSTMPVGTDSLLLGALTDPGQASRILDAGTGCGVLALMMAQKSGAIIDAVELDEGAVLEATENFERSPWSSRLACFGISLQLFAFLTDHRYDLIISNPPFFSDSLKSAERRKNLARHNLTLTMEELLTTVQSLLKKGGRFSFIIPAEQWPKIRKLAENQHLYPAKLIYIYPYPGARAKRVIAELTQDPPAQTYEAELTILNEDRKYSSDYLEATKEFHKIYC